MRRRILTLIGVVLLIALIGGFLRFFNGGEERLPPAYSFIAGGTNDFVNCSNEFAFDMYRELVNGDENVFFSPFSISIALAMAYEGAGGRTAEEIISLLKLPTDDQERWEMVRAVLMSLNRGDRSYVLHAPNAYWLMKGREINDDYKEVIEQYYLAHGEELDFAGDPTGSADRINSWVEENTNSKIKNLVKPEDINPDTFLILTNAIYFKADWLYQFDEEATENMTFHKSNGGEVTVEMMHMCDESKKINYAETKEVQMVQLPYKDQELSMYIILPKENNITDLQDRIDEDYFRSLKKKIEGRYVDLYMPKFKFEKRYELSRELSDMGMPTAFSDRANFSGITREEELYIGEVIHKSFIEVNEKGTEAAAATAVVLRYEGGSVSHPSPILFKADHPFIFIIEHKETGQILFMGKVENPNL
ncbi:MAG: serpin family protein [Thermoplasmata archaeon]|nr:serpin family protein [Thermoplasmata archaeon]